MSSSVVLDQDYGEIPKDWSVKSAERFAGKVTDGTHDSPKQKTQGRYLVTSRHIKTRNIDFDNAYLISQADFEKINERSRVDQWNVIISMIGEYCGFVYLERNKAIDYAVKNVGIFKTANEICGKWLYYLLQSPKAKEILDSLRGGTSQPYLSLGALRSFSVLHPNSSYEQQAIVSVLSSLDDKIDLLHRQNKTLEAMAETLFRQWFVEEAKEDWEEVELGTIVSVVDNRGKTPPYSDYDSQYPLIEVNALGKENRIVDYSQIRKYVDKDTFEKWFRGKPQKYDTLISTVGSIGALSMFLIEKGNIAQNVVALHADKISPFYIYQFLKYRIDEIMQLDIGGVQPSIKVPHLLSLLIKLPDSQKLIEFDRHLVDISFKLESNYFHLQTLAQLRDTLLPKLMSGEVRVKYD